MPSDTNLHTILEDSLPSDNEIFPEHICISLPCTFCAVMRGDPVDESRLIRFQTAEMRLIMSEIATQLPRKGIEYAAQILMLVELAKDEKVAEAPPQPAGVKPAERPRPSLAFSKSRSA